MRFELRRGPLLLGWTPSWFTAVYDDHILIATPCLFLEPDPAQDMVAGNGIVDVLGMAVSNLDPAKPFVVLHGSFALYHSAEATVENFAGVIPGTSPTPIGVLIHRTAELLRCDPTTMIGDVG